MRKLHAEYKDIRQNGWIVRQVCYECDKTRPCFSSFDERDVPPKNVAPCPYRKDLTAVWRDL